MDYQQGLIFYRKPATEVEILKKYGDKYYQVKETYILTGESVDNTLLTPEQIQNYLDNQDEIIKGVIKAIEFNNKQKKLQEDQDKKELEQQQEYENVYGYLDNKTPMQKGKILKILNKETHYYSDGKYLGYWTRKEFLYNMINNGYIIEHKKDLKYWGKGYEEKIKANEYRLVAPDNSFYEITKTEYDYTEYLIKNVLIDKIA